VRAVGWSPACAGERVSAPADARQQCLPETISIVEFSSVVADARAHEQLLTKMWGEFENLPYVANFHPSSRYRQFVRKAMTKVKWNVISNASLTFTLPQSKPST
jgi:hypothetical protein